MRSDEKCRDRATSIDAEIRPGMREGDELVFARMSEQRPGALPGDVRMRLKLERGAAGGGGFERKGDDLHTELSISLKAALLGFEAELVHLDGRSVPVARRGVSPPGTVVKLKGEGMPKHGTPSEFGDLTIQFTVDFPKEIGAELASGLAAG